MHSLATINGKLQTSGSRYSAECLEREAALIRQETVPADFDGLARYCGYNPGTLRKYIGGETARGAIIDRISLIIPAYADNHEILADAYLRELAQEVAPLMAAE